MISIARFVISMSALLIFVLPGFAQDHRDGQHGRHGNPANLESYIERLNDPGRDEWQQPERVIEALNLEPGQVACDIGAGPGYFSLRLARAVGAGGRVFAVDVEPVILRALLEALDAAGVSNITPILALGDDPLLPEAACDVVLIVNTYHHFPDGPAYLRRLAHALTPQGRIVNIDLHPGTPGAPRHSIDRDVFIEQAEAGGLEVERQEEFLGRQYFLVLRPTRPIS